MIKFVLENIRGEKLNMNFGKCPNCGGNLIYDIKKECMYCEHCATSIEIENKKIKKTIIDKANNKTDNDDNLYFFECTNCGAEYLLEDMEINFNCPFCKTSNLAEVKDMNNETPQGMVVFSISDQDARKILVDNANSKYSESIKIISCEKIYVPCYVFDMELVADFTFSDIGIKEHEIIETKNYVHIANDRGIPSYLANIIKVDSNMIVEFDERYIAGYTAEKSTISLIRVASQVKEDLIKMWQKENDCSYLQYTYDTIKETYTYILFPIYMISYEENKNKEVAFINGYDGRFLKVGDKREVDVREMKYTKIKDNRAKLREDFIMDIIWAIILIFLCFLFSFA